VTFPLATIRSWDPPFPPSVDLRLHQANGLSAVGEIPEVVVRSSRLPFFSPPLFSATRLSTFRPSRGLPSDSLGARQWCFCGAAMSPDHFSPFFFSYTGAASGGEWRWSARTSRRGSTAYWPPFLLIAMRPRSSYFLLLGIRFPQSHAPLLSPSTAPRRGAFFSLNVAGTEADASFFFCRFEARRLSARPISPGTFPCEGDVEVGRFPPSALQARGLTVHSLPLTIIVGWRSKKFWPYAFFPLFLCSAFPGLRSAGFRSYRSNYPFLTPCTRCFLFPFFFFCSCPSN